MADVFGDLGLFSEFEKEREAQGSFIHYDEDANKSRIIFEDYASENESESDGEAEVISSQNDPPEGRNSDQNERSSPSANRSSKEGNHLATTSAEDGEIQNQMSEAFSHDSNGVNESKKAKESEKTSWLNAQLYDEAAEEAKKTNTTAQQLIFERNKFHRLAKILDSTRYTPDDESPAVQLMFNNNSFARKYRQQIEQFIKGLLWEEFRAPAKESFSEITVKPGHPSCVDINKKLTPEQRTEHMRQKHAIIGNSQFHKQFLIDFLGWPFNVAEPTRCNVNWEIPLYVQIFNEVFTQKSLVPDATAKPSKPKPACWNCSDTNHAIMDCKVPKNPARIAANKKDFMATQSKGSGPKFSGPSRYHKDPDLASKFTKFKPGVISPALQDALGLQSNQLPQHIYRMRLHGYPPGWLAEAKQIQSGVTIFDKHGRVTLITGECLEDGELDDDDQKDESQSDLDVNKIIEYSGFTMPVPEGFQDECETFHMPPIQEHQLKQSLLQAEKSPSRKRKRAKEGDDKVRIKKIKTEKKDATAEGEKNEEAEEDGEVRDEEFSDVQEIVKEEEATTSATTPVVERSSSTKSLSVDFGTPIFTREKSSLPDACLFGKGIEDHIPFENLPDATGTFEKMKDLIELIRKRNKK